MENDPIFDDEPDRPAPQATSLTGQDIEEVPFRPFRVLTRRVVFTMIAFTIGMCAGALNATHGATDPRAALFHMGLLFGLLLTFILAPRISTKRKGGTPPLRFGKDEIEVPVTASQRKTRTIPYADILSVAVFGRGKRAAVVLDTTRRAFVYPLREFANENAADMIRDILRRRIAALEGGAAQWQQIEKRHSVAGALAMFRPLATWIMVAAICVAFIAQLAGPDDPVFGYLDMGANAPLLVFNGEWYRLVTANLLHAGFLHIYCNAFFGYIVGALVERQLGTRRFAILLLFTGIASHAVSAGWSLYAQNGHLFSVGISGALFGMLGAQAVLNKRFGAQLPGGYRFTARTWWSTLILNFVVIPVAVPEVDVACHIGGFISGMLAGWVLCRGQTDIAEPPPFGAGLNAVLAFFCALWIGAVAQDLANIFNPDVRDADRAALTRGIISANKPDAALDNVIAWGLATKVKPSADDLSAAMTLATRAVTNSGAKNGKPAREFIDTLATVHYRLGNLDDAVMLEEPLFVYSPLYGSQLARFLNAYVHEHGGPRFIGGKTAEPQVTMTSTPPFGDRAFELTLAAPSPKGAEIYALVKDGGKLLGILDISVWPDAVKAKGTILHDAFPAGGDLSLSIAQVDTTGCRCTGDADVSASYVPMEKEVADLP
jgi:membrane associated rhomboid family serine protease